MSEVIARDHNDDSSEYSHSLINITTIKVNSITFFYVGYV